MYTCYIYTYLNTYIIICIYLHMLHISRPLLIVCPAQVSPSENFIPSHGYGKLWAGKDASRFGGGELEVTHRKM